jgi:hypothetical protein
MSPFLTSKENIAVNLIYAWLSESRSNRTYAEYMEIASRFPKLSACHAHVNQRLREMAEAGFAPYQLCYFKAGDLYTWYEDFRPHYRWKPCALLYSRWACHRTAAAKCLIFL